MAESFADRWFNHIVQPLTAETMTVPLYQTHYCGGPYDGCVVVGSRQMMANTLTLLVPITWDADGAVGINPPLARLRRAVYRIRRKRQLVERELDIPTTWCELEFVGYEPVATARLARKRGQRVADCFKRLIRRSVWLLLPEGRPNGSGQGSA